MPTNRPEHGQTCNAKGRTMKGRTSEREPQKCPKCGHAPRVSTCGYWVACDGCYLMGPRGKTPAAAIAAWNGLRYGEAPKPAEPKRLREPDAFERRVWKQAMKPKRRKAVRK